MPQIICSSPLCFSISHAWHLGLKKTDHKTLTGADFYKSRLQIRNNDFNIMFRVKKLTQQYAVDQWAKIEAGRQDWVRRNHKS